MLLSLFTKLGLWKPSPTKMIIQQADSSFKFPQGIVEKLLVKLGSFVFPVSFVILDMTEDREVRLIFGRSFL